ncbi:MAG: acetolactate synthase [Zetaproteobacteria bacterium CG06_land_8_20_14_3_00_59_53]|nr:MAG: acetolactate synthase [Zetaproteobacteria bacterium CG23_combo_of_CG06-09_8_20_14_all_59_86]PIQ64251.1 MAG: acetolactate synthase [Zetaproteobacteria bacterium CG11_big_fil_rev_8_21_14_0_20_59_439]PIU70403.1 MAG: acetolactate synthase [Zetaproteobacteria bacterium CG06_land_8_20_14_3_00_59_53]PIU97473.1 MAG: acetolactate synthase [Zetaproteobacteria bacterium CG03_land_8_20_14_0_80_59_51]PIY46613.1 MAG: acetolactate synthase [Zetaproteobacteria bacterium CG_4_10_14_0_8_um_filter_59_127]
MKASDALAKYLVSHGVQTCFELVGGMITHILDSFAETGQFNIISMHHEQAAAFAAEGVVRQTRGKEIALAMGTSGPGATNLITGIGSCWFDSVPCLFITGQVNTHELKGDRSIRQQGFQELGIIEVVRPLTKYAVRVDTPEDLLPELHKALSMALSGRQGPVLLDIPNDVQRADISDALVEQWMRLPLDIESGPDITGTQLEHLTSLCMEARRPLICIGGGARWADSMDGWLLAADALGIPYVSTLMGHERVVSRPCYFNMIGSYGNREANWAVQNCDLLIVVGARLDVRQTGADVDDFARSARIVQIDIDPSQLGNRVQADLSICATAESFFMAFPPRSLVFPNLDENWLIDLAVHRDRAQFNEYADWEISPSEFIKKLNRSMGNRPVDYVCDVGNHQMWAAQNLRLSPNQAVHYSGGMGAMGFALPAALGMAIYSGNKVVVITGDGSLQINIQELDTLIRLGLDLTIIVMNNSVLGMVKNFQDMYFDGRDQSTRKGYSSPSFTDIANAYGMKAMRVTEAAEIVEALSLVSGYTGPLLIEVMMDGATECRPRLAFGSKLDEQFPRLEA